MHLFYRNVGLKAAVRASGTSSTLRAQKPHPPREIATNGASTSTSIRFEEGWTLADVANEQVLFSPFSAAEVEEGMADLVRLAARPASGVTSVTDCDSSSGGEMDNSADEIIEMIRFSGASVSGAEGGMLGVEDPASRNQLDELLRITSIMLKRPGMQREVVQCMIEDPEVRNLMLRQSTDLDAYLMAAGISTPGLLPAGAAPAPHRSLVSRFALVGSSTSGSSAASDVDEQNLEENSSPFEALLQSMSTMIEGVAGFGRNVVNFLGGWMRDRLHDLSGEGREGVRGKAAAGGGVAEAGEGGGSSSGRPLVKTVLSGVMVLAMVCMVLMLLKRPLMLRRIVMRA